MAMGNYKAALADYNEAVDLEPSESSYYLNRANCKLLLGDKDGAKADAALFKNPALAQAQKKSLNYYWAKYSALPDKLNDMACLQLLDTMAAEYPGDESVLGIIVHHVNHVKNAEVANTYKQKYASNTTYGPAFKAMFLMAMNDNTQAYTAIIEALNNGLALHNAALIFPGLQTQTDYCSLLSKYQTNHSKAMAKNSEAMKILNENINNKLKIVDVDPTASLSLAIQYLSNGDGQNALKYLDQYLNAGEYNLNVISAEYKINALFMLGRTQDGVEFARSYYMKEKDGMFKDLPQMKLIGNIASNHCGFSTLPPPQEPKESGKKKK